MSLLLFPEFAIFIHSESVMGFEHRVTLYHVIWMVLQVMRAKRFCWGIMFVEKHWHGTIQRSLQKLVHAIAIN